MYVFRRSVTIQAAALTPKAVGFAMEVTGYINGKYNLNMKSGIELFGGLNLHWQFESDSLDKMSAINSKLFEDKAYWQLLEKGKDFWVPGSLKDTIINMP